MEGELFALLKLLPHLLIRFLTSRSLLTSLMEPPSLPPPSPTSSNPPITNDTPLPSLFKLTPTLFPKFQSGLSQTAARSAETLKGSSSTAYRNARFGQRSASGRTSIEGEGQASSIHGAKGYAGDEFDVDAPGAAKPTKSSWWGASGGQTKKEDEGSVGIPDPIQVDQERNTESPDPAPSAIGRLIGRFKRPTNNPVTQAPSRPSMEQKAEPEEWNPRDLDALEAPPVSKIAQAKQDEASMDDALSDFFGDTRKGSGRLPTKPPVEEFGGLMGAFAEAPRKVSKPVVKSKKALDPFDPFADDEEESQVAAAPPMVPKVVTSPTRSSTPRVASPLSRPLTPQSPHRAHPETSATVASFPSPLAAPQARGVSTITTNTIGDGGDDSFDAFFSSVTSSTAKPSSAPPLVSPPIVPALATRTAPRSIVAPPPPRISTLSPPPRASTISPPASSGSPLSALAPPPPPSQPLNRGGFNIAPPPPSASPSLTNQSSSLYASAPPPVVATPRPPPPKPSGSGALSKEDWAFFEA